MDFQGSLSTLAKILIITSTACFVVTGKLDFVNYDCFAFDNQLELN